MTLEQRIENLEKTVLKLIKHQLGDAHPDDMGASTNRDDLEDIATEFENSLASEKKDDK